MIRFEDVCITRGEQVIVDRLSLSIGVGEKIALVGDSGVGKTSLLRALVGVVPLSGGRILVDGIEVGPGNICEVRRKIAFIEQEPVLGTGGTGGAEVVRDALLLPFGFRANRGDLPSAEERIDEVLDAVGLERGILKKRTAVVSGGEKQRLALARALLQNKKIILADEPTSALADDQRAAVVEVLADSTLTVIAVTHQPEWRARADRVLTMQAGGEVVEMGGGR